MLNQRVPELEVYRSLLWALPQLRPGGIIDALDALTERRPVYELCLLLTGKSIRLDSTQAEMPTEACAGFTPANNAYDERLCTEWQRALSTLKAMEDTAKTEHEQFWRSANAAAGVTIR